MTECSAQPNLPRLHDAKPFAPSRQEAKDAKEFQFNSIEINSLGPFLAPWRDPSFSRLPSRHRVFAFIRNAVCS
jgi:hypothetical protein